MGWGLDTRLIPIINSSHLSSENINRIWGEAERAPHTVQLCANCIHLCIYNIIIILYHRLSRDGPYILVAIIGIRNIIDKKSLKELWYNSEMIY